MVNNQSLILHKTGHKNGKKNGYGFYKHNQHVTASQVESVVVVVDLGYLRVQKDFPIVKSIVLPYRKKRKSEPSLEERRYNKKRVKLRIVVEHTTICRIKKFGIIGSKFRKRLRCYDVISNIVSVLINFMIMRSNGMRV
jgi:hypothetical protein